MILIVCLNSLMIVHFFRSLCLAFLSSHVASHNYSKTPLVDDDDGYAVVGDGGEGCAHLKKNAFGKGPLKRPSAECEIRQ